MQTEQITRANDGPGGEPTAVPQTVLGDAEIPDIHLIQQFNTGSRAKRRRVNIDLLQSEGVKKQNMKGTK